MSGGRTDLQTAKLETTWGDISIAAGARGVSACHLPAAAARSIPLRVLRVRLPRPTSSRLKQAANFVRALVEGRAPGACPKLDESVLAGAPDFRRAIWTALGKIPRGRTATYAELARRAGHPRAARAAGSACGANPLPLFIPCHRAMAAGGRSGGFSAGLAWKVQLLSAEGARR
jgi:O-6-methylguanine DNA methyltransferase